MTQMLEHIMREIKTLPPVERFNLWRDLGQEFDPPMVEGDDEESVEAAWNAEIDDRVKEIEDGKVELVSAEEAEQRIRAKLAQRRNSHVMTA
ncbi:MAG: addiction module protein [Prosthecobacter sp.]